MKFSVFGFFLLTMFYSGIAFTQVIKLNKDNFEVEFFKYEPVQKEGVSDSDFKDASYRLREVKIALKKDNYNFTYADYLNAYSTFKLLKESKELLKIAFVKFAESDGSCYYIINHNKNFKFSELFPEDYSAYLKKCQKEEKAEEKTDPKEYAENGNFEQKIIELINQISIDDQKYRDLKTNNRSNNEKQTSLDRKNQVLIDSLYAKYGEYIGVSVVGEKYSSVMWAVIQHSNINMMEKYLPVIHMAVKNKELHEVPLKMLIDRICMIKHKYQIFGSQAGVTFADSVTRIKVKKEYGFH